MSAKSIFLNIITAASVLLCSCKSEVTYQVSESNLRRVTEEVSSDDFMGRKPFTYGEELTVSYLERELISIGFQPAFGDSYYQDVPMVEVTSSVKGDIIVAGKALKWPDNIALNSPLTKEIVSLKNVPMVFCGFGIVAPEYGWDDFKGVDVTDKIVVVLINDPGLYTEERDLFKGREMTYYGRWTYKYEQAAAMGAAGVIIIHNTTGAGYGFNVPRNSAVSSKLFIDNEGIEKNCSVTGWISEESAESILNERGLSIESLTKMALQREFIPFELDITLSVDVKNRVERNSSRNVAGILRGTKRPDEAIIVTAHWDHFGIGEAVRGDSIYNGAVDNGTTIAWALEIGRVLSTIYPKPERSVILLFPTAEEQGLTGSSYYVENPAVPMEKTIACLNNDMMVPRGAMKDVTIIGYGYSELDKLYEKAALKQERYLLPDPNSHTGLFFRSDHFPFFRAGVPSIWAMGCFHSKEHGEEWAKQSWDKFIKEVYHTPFDNYNHNWDWSGVVNDTRLAIDVILELSKAKTERPAIY